MLEALTKMTEAQALTNADWLLPRPVSISFTDPCLGVDKTEARVAGKVDHAVVCEDIAFARTILWNTRVSTTDH